MSTAHVKIVIESKHKESNDGLGLDKTENASSSRVKSSEKERE